MSGAEQPERMYQGCELGSASCPDERLSLHCDDACGGRGLGLTRVFTGLVPLP